MSEGSHSVRESHTVRERSKQAFGLSLIPWELCNINYTMELFYLEVKGLLFCTLLSLQTVFDFP